MSSLSAFLHPEQKENREVIVSERFKEDGKPVPFIIRPLTQKENEALLRKFRKTDKKTGLELFDRIAYNQEMVASSVVFPDLTNAELQERYSGLGAAKTLISMLYVGEFATLLNAVQELSGLDTDINEDIEDAKNG